MLTRAQVSRPDAAPGGACGSCGSLREGAVRGHAAGRRLDRLRRRRQPLRLRHHVHERRDDKGNDLLRQRGQPGATDDPRLVDAHVLQRLAYPRLEGARAGAHRPRDRADGGHRDGVRLPPSRRRRHLRPGGATHVGRRRQPALVRRHVGREYRSALRGARALAAPSRRSSVAGAVVGDDPVEPRREVRRALAGALVARAARVARGAVEAEQPAAHLHRLDDRLPDDVAAPGEAALHLGEDRERAPLRLGGQRAHVEALQGVEARLRRCLAPCVRHRLHSPLLRGREVEVALAVGVRVRDTVAAHAAGVGERGRVGVGARRRRLRAAPGRRRSPGRDGRRRAAAGEQQRREHDWQSPHARTTP